ncbi:P-loop containing nucleoside triphosphate hydrolase protein [Lineolata rhizophorae]|uniref:Kinesin-like protein n=1 Tax=Lineolata rhizophorae TaxID=578093 RepID=A0A6A6NQ54_9PEZI|nr:P-loop containing nucleoside triphosphate hydrolase protein [Lineolata rhizophorae]
MNPNTQQTTLIPPAAGEVSSSGAHGKGRRPLDEKSFTFDHSFWSHNETDPHYATQEDIYHSFGVEFLDHNFEGYHTCIFAYGQTGSGKSYTMMGTPEQPGLIPRTCGELFDRINNHPEPNTTYNVYVSYFEVYNEHVRDLLVPRTSPPSYLKIRESPADGVYVQGLTDVQVKNYDDVARLMKAGDTNRTTASTKMNDTSSRSHAVFTIVLKQIAHDMDTDETVERTARMRLVDLAGSERAKATEAKGQRLVEGGKINQSLTTLGRVIAALADQAAAGGGGGSGTPTRPGTPRGGGGGGVSGSPRKHSAPAKVPYRDSVLTYLLKDSLGGNSKTAMVACIAPSDYDETLSTLRYADRAKRIRTRATVNRDALSAAQRDAQIAAMAETIRALQLNLNSATARNRERALSEQEAAANAVEDYQKQVVKMQRLMDEKRQLAERKIDLLARECDELRRENAKLRGEIEPVRRHLGLALGELKNPIVVPGTASPTKAATAVAGTNRQLAKWAGAKARGVDDAEDKENAGARGITGDNGAKDGGVFEDRGFHGDDDDSGLDEDDESGYEDSGNDEEALAIQRDAEELMKELGLWRKRHAEDVARFAEPGGRCGSGPLMELAAFNG